jgi:hypothetical protein
MSEVRDCRVHQCYLGAVPAEKFSRILADYVENFDDRGRKPVSKKYIVEYKTTDYKYEGKSYPRTVAYIYAEDLRFAYRLSGCDDDGNATFITGRMDLLDDIMDFSVFTELYGLHKEDLIVDDAKIQTPTLPSKPVRYYPANPKPLLVSEVESLSYPGDSSARTTGSVEFVIKNSLLATPPTGSKPGVVKFGAGMTSAVLCKYNSDPTYHPIVDERAKTVTFKNAIDAQRAVTMYTKGEKMVKFDGGVDKTSPRSKRPHSEAPHGRSDANPGRPKSGQKFSPKIRSEGKFRVAVK